MARIPCPECKRQISETADSCPKCGYKLTPEEAAIIKKRQQVKWTHCRGQNNGKISKIIESHRHSFSRNRPQPALHNRDSGEVVGHYRNGYNELIHRKELVPSGTVSDKHLHT